MIVAFIVIAVILWGSIGWLLLKYFNKPAGKENYRRSVERSVYTLGETVKVTLQLTPPTSLPSVESHDVLLVLDHSGSMGSAPGSPLQEAIRAAENFVHRLPAPFHIGLIVFDHEAQLHCGMTEKKPQILEALGTIGSGGGTAIHLALNKCQDALNEARKDAKKTVILLSDGESDHNKAKEAAEQLKNHSAHPQIICIGFGPHVDIELLKSVADSKEHCIHVDSADKLESLFVQLANTISGQKAIMGFVNEGVMNASHAPFRLGQMGGLYPTSIQTEQETRIVWSVPLLEQQSVSSQEPVFLNYELTPRCVGWHPVALPDSKAIWEMPEGNKQKINGPKGPKVLILREGSAWIAYLFPLVFLLFKNLVKCQPVLESQESDDVEPLSLPTLPDPLPPPKVDVYSVDLRPALVIGLGELGEWTICHLKNQLRDRELDTALIDLVVVQNTEFHNRPDVTVGNCSLNDQERVVLKQDLRPYLEKIRKQGGTPELRNWIPWRQWLAETVPLTTCGKDRRKSRLALLLQPEKVENRLKNQIEQIQEKNGRVFIVGEAGDAETSGMLAEIAHICAPYKMGCTVILQSAPYYDDDISPHVAGMVNELERMITLRGEPVYSDRGGQSRLRADRLFDSIISVSGDEKAHISNLVWAILAYPEILKQKMPISNTTGCYQVQWRSNNLPQLSLWEWARERTLNDLINQQWLGLDMTAKPLMLPATNSGIVSDYRDQFWRGTDLKRSSGKFLQQAALMLGDDEKPNPLKLIMDETHDLPLARPYHEQKTYCDKERQIFLAYLEEWCHFVLEKEQDKRENEEWVLFVLWHTIQQLEQDFDALIESLNKLSGSEYFMNLLAFVLSMYVDYRAILNRVRGNVEHWISVFVGWRPNMTVNRLPQNFTSVCWNIEEHQKATEKRLSFPNEQQGPQAVEIKYQQWLKENSEPFLKQLRFQLKRKEQHFTFQLRCFDRSLEAVDDIPATFREQLDRYKDVVFQWPTIEWVNSETLSNPHDWERIGKFSGVNYSNIRKNGLNEDDPFFTAALLVDEIQPDRLPVAFSVRQTSGAIYTWPEEANAARIADKIRHILKRNPRHFSPKLIYFMRDTKKLHGFMGDLAENRVTLKGQRIILHRDGKEFEIGPSEAPLEGIERFEEIVRQVVALEEDSSGESLPPPSDWSNISSDEAVRQVEKHDLVKSISATPAWEMWQDVIRGLALEHS